MEVRAIDEIPQHVRFKLEYKAENGLRCKIYKQSTIIYVKIIKGYIIKERYIINKAKNVDLTEAAKCVLKTYLNSDLWK